MDCRRQARKIGKACRALHLPPRARASQRVPTGPNRIANGLLALFKNAILLSKGIGVALFLQAIFVLLDPACPESFKPFFLL